MRVLALSRLLIIVVWGLSPGVQAEPGYPVSEIPEALKTHANVVVRDDQMQYTLVSTKKATFRRKYVVTILNPKGSRFAKLTLGYDRLTRISSLAAIVYDADGKVVRKLKPGEVEDLAAQDGFSLFLDDRLKWVDMTHSTHPYTVEFSYQIEYKFVYAIPGMTIAKESVSVQQASYQLVFPRDLAPRYRMVNWQTGPVEETREGGMESLTWSFSHIQPFLAEPHGPHPDELVPRIIAAPTVFDYDGFTGDMSSWESYGKWNGLLRQGREDLPEKTRAKVRELSSRLTSTEQKVKVLYEYLQSKTRYVSIQEGIGGLQPFSATVVDETGYGDCKALSNYMIALLKEAGIKGYYCRIRAGDDEPDLIRDFPSHQTNHIIVAVPNAGDTLWLECTSQTQAFGYLGRFTADRMALMVTDNGGKLVRTPAYSAEQNRQFRTAELKIDVAGNGKARVRTTYTGTQTENDGLAGAIEGKADDQRKWIQENTEIPSFNIASFSMKGSKEKMPSIVVHMQLDLSHYASVSGKRLFVMPNLMNRVTYTPEKLESRKSEVVRYLAYNDIDTVTIILPETLYPEFVPKPMKVTSPFGEYEATCSFDNGKVVYIRKMIMRKGKFPKETYPELIEFYRSVSKFDNLKLVLLNKT